MPEIKPLLFMIGLLLGLLSLGLAPSMLVDFAFQHPDWKIFAFCIVFSGFFSGALLLTHPFQPFIISRRALFLNHAIGWLVLCAFAALPFHFCGLDMSYTDSFFEAVSGLTTTGSTVMTALDTTPPGILLWRAMLQWIGGIGIVMSALSFFPALQIGGMQLFRSASDDTERTLPRLISLSLSLILIYGGLTLACCLAYIMAGMGKFDALAHAMTTVSTGGFSTHDASLGYFENNAIEYVASLFMLSGALPFLLYLSALKGHPGALLRDSQVRWFGVIVLLSIGVCAFSLISTQDMTPGEALHSASFNVISLATGTGFTSHNYNLWGGFILTLFFFLMAMGGCAGSTACGIKIFRFQILWSVIRAQLKTLRYPHSIFVSRYNGQPVPQDIPLAVLSFLFLYTASFVFLTLALAFLGLDTLTALSASITALSNVGPGMGDIIGPMGNFAPLPQAAKWCLSFGMLLGRLEIATILVLCHPLFWKE